MLNFICKKTSQTIAMAAVAMSALTLEAEDVYKEDFSNFKTKTKLMSIVKVNGEPEIKQALRLETMLNKSGKPVFGSWRSPNFDVGDAAIVTVDYYIKPETESCRYALFVHEKGGKQLVATIIDQGYFKCNSLGAWNKVAEVKYGAWQHVRYSINLLSSSYDFYVDDMTKPKTSGIKYRCKNGGIPSRLWTESSENQPAVSYFANVSVEAKRSATFPPLGLSRAPFYVAGANKTAIAPALDGKGDSAPWKNVPALSFDKESGNIKEGSFVKLLWDDKNLYVFFSAQAKDMAKRKNGQTMHDAKVWMDDCFEIFLDPGFSGKNYYHVVGNGVGGLYDASRKEDSGCNASWTSSLKMAFLQNKENWTIEMAIPFASLGKEPESGDIWGFNAGRENPVTGEVSAWRPLKSFHTPKMFGKILFIDPEYEKIPRAEQIKNLGERLYESENLLKAAAENVKTIQSNKLSKEYFKERGYKLNKKIAECKKSLNTIQNFIEFYKSSMEAKKLLEDSQTLSSDANRLVRFFGPGSEGAERKYVICVESSMEKVPFENYAGSSETKADLQLAGREYGSFQSVVLTEPGMPLKGVSIKISELKDKNGKALSDGKIKSFLVDYISSAKPSSRQEKIADALLPGKEFKFKQALEIVPIWFDVYLPPKVPAGEYSATILITPDGCETTKIPVNVKALPFTLPLKASLPNAFCFVDSWVEGYYKKKIPQEKRYEYMQFILDHRLEPMNLWMGRNNKLCMSEEELAWAEERGKAMLFLSISKSKKSEQYYHDIIKKFDGRLKPVFFGYDEVLMVSKKRHGYLEEMQSAFKKVKEKFPNIPRLNTSEIDKRLYGYVDIWCPLFSYFNSKDAEERKVKGEQVWWYPTDYPLQPYANFNLDSPGIDPRVIPWMNWKLNISGLLYWALNREWLTNFQEAERLNQKEKNARGLDWMTQEVQEKVKKGLRWPDVPWIPYFRAVNNKNASPSVTNGGGNMMYPGPDFQPISSIRLKNLRDGMQDYEYFVILKKNIQKLEENNANKELVARAKKALSLDKVVDGAVVYTKDPEVLNKAKANLALLIVGTQNELSKEN